MPEQTTLPNSINTSSGTDSNPAASVSIPATPAITPTPASSNDNFINDDGKEVSGELPDATPKAPPAPDTVTPGINFDAFKDLLDGNAPIAINTKPVEASIKKTEEVKKEEKPSVEEPKSIKLEDVGKQPENITAEVAQDNNPASPQTKDDKYNARDLTDIPAPLQTFFKKNMSVEAFKAIKPYVVNLEKEIKKTKEENDTLRQGVVTIPESYYENPESVKLTPKYQELSTSIDMASQAYNHFKQQLIKMERGENWQDLELDKDGKLVALAPKAATAEDKINVGQNMQQILGIYNAKQQELQGMQANFKQKHQESVKILTDINKQYFSPFMDEKSPWKPTIEKIKSMIPEAFRESPLAEAYVYSLTANLAMQAKITQYEKDANKTKTIATTVRNAGPTENSSSGSSSSGAPKIATFDEIQARMNGV